MEKKKIKKSDLSGLCRPALKTGTQPNRSASYYGSSDSDGSYGYGYGGTSGYYTLEEFYSWEGVWPGGWVYGLGYVAPDAVIEGYYPYYGGGEDDEEEPPYYYSYSEYDDYEEHNPHDYPTYYYDNTYYYYDPYYDDGYSHGGGGGGGSSTPSPGSSTPQTDGVNISNTNNFKFNTGSNPVFTTQLTRILTSNSVIKKMLTYFDRGYVRLNIGIRELEDPDTGAITYHNPEDIENYYIDFNSRFITDNGWAMNDYQIKDNIGFNWDEVKTKEEALVVTLAHEAIHAQYYAWYYDFFYLNEGDPYQIWQYFIKHGYSEDFVGIFLNEKRSGFNDNNEVERRMHKYMERHDLGRIQDALNEYRSDFPQK